MSNLPLEERLKRREELKVHIADRGERIRELKENKQKIQDNINKLKSKNDDELDEVERLEGTIQRDISNMDADKLAEILYLDRGNGNDSDKWDNDFNSKYNIKKRVDGNYVCGHCGKEWKHYASANEHIIRTHPEKEANKKTETKKKNGYPYKTRKDGKIVCEARVSPYNEDKCGELFKSRNSTLYKHMKEEHGINKED